MRNADGIVRLATGIPKNMKTHFVEYDVVRSTRALSDVVPAGTTGAVLMVFPSAHPQYEVEFVDRAGESVSVLTVQESNLELIEGAG